MPKTNILLLGIIGALYSIIPKANITKEIKQTKPLIAIESQIIIRLPDEIVKAPKPETAFECLRKNLYLEAGNQGKEGMIAVANVVFNRINSKHYPNNVCDVIYQAQYKNGKLVKHACQFSWYCDGKSDNVHINKWTRNSWNMAGNVAKAALKGELEDVSNGATHYHELTISPHWAETLEYAALVGDHIFYK